MRAGRATLVLVIAATGCSLVTSLDGYTGGAADGGGVAAADASIEAAVLTPGVPVKLAADANGARGLALYAGDVYWVNAAGAIQRVPKKGGAAQTIGAGGTKLVSIAVDATAIFVTDEGDSSVKRVLFDGTTKVIASGQSNPWGIALDGTYAYYTTLGEARRQLENFTGGAPTRVGSAASGADIVVGAGRVFWLSTVGTDAVDSVPLAGGSVQCHFNNQTSPHGLATDGTSIFHAVHQPRPGGKIRKKDLSETCSTDAREIATGVDSPFSLAVDAKNVYWTEDRSDGAIRSLPKDGSGQPTTLATGQDVPWGIVVDPDTGTLYWTSSGPTGGVMALVR